MRRLLLKIWRILPLWLQRMAAWVLRPRYQVAVGAFILNDRGQLLLCEHTYRRLHPWGLPGGDLHFGEDPVEGIRRELKEETGLEAGEVKLLLVENSRQMKHLALTYLCTDVHGTFTPSDEVASIRYFDQDALPTFFAEDRETIEKCIALVNKV